MPMRLSLKKASIMFHHRHSYSLKKMKINLELRKVVPEGLYLCMYYRGGGLEEYHESFEILNDYMKDHNMALNGMVYQICKIDVTLTSKPTETLMEIQVPVKKI